MVKEFGPFIFSVCLEFASTGFLVLPLNTMMAFQVLYFPVTGLYRVLGAPFEHYDDHTGFPFPYFRARGSVWHLDLCLLLFSMFAYFGHCLHLTLRKGIFFTAVYLG